MIYFIIIYLTLTILFVLLRYGAPHKYLILKNLILIGYISIKALIDDKLNSSSNEIAKFIKCGEVAVVTGGSGGIGLEVVKAFLEMRMDVIIGCRNVENTERLIKRLRNNGLNTGTAHCYYVDMSSFRSIYEFFLLIKKNNRYVNILVNNAAVLKYPFHLTCDKIEYILQTNYLGHFYLTSLLIKLLKEGANDISRNSRVINVSSYAYEVASINFPNINLLKEFRPERAYIQSKLAQILFTFKLENLFKYRNIPIQVHAVNPGLVNTNFYKSTWFKYDWLKKLLLFKSPEEGARSILYASINQLLESRGGTYISNCSVVKTANFTRNIILQDQFWYLSLDMLNFSTFHDIK